jgi:hypothetical protein
MTTIKNARTSAGKNNTHGNHSPKGIDTLLSCLDRVKRTGNGTWIARCPAHADKGPSLSIRETDEGKTLLHCFAGCSAHEVVAAVGLEITDLFPARPADPAHIGRPERRPFPAADALRAVAFEATIVGLAGAAIIAGEPFSQFDKDRLLLAVGRINDALSAAGLAHG